MTSTAATGTVQEEAKQLASSFGGGSDLQAASGTTATGFGTTGGLGSGSLGSSSYSPYSSGMYGGYGRGMYGGGYGMGGMYGGMGGMYGGMGGMYGGMGMQGGNMQGRPLLERMSMYVFQLCEIAQMVEFNANGLYQFFFLLKKVSVATVDFGKEWLWWLI